MKCYLGIDNGLRGGLVTVSAAGEILDLHPMPTVKVGKKREVDAAEVDRLLRLLKSDYAEIEAAIEEPVGSKSAAAGISMAGSFHALRSVLDLNQIPYKRVRARDWQKSMLTWGDTKERALAAAEMLWLDHSFILPGCRVPHDGLVDAALIAAWLWMKSHGR